MTIEDVFIRRTGLYYRRSIRGSGRRRPPRTSWPFARMERAEARRRIDPLRARGRRGTSVARNPRHRCRPRRVVVVSADAEPRFDQGDATFEFTPMRAGVLDDRVEPKVRPLDLFAKFIDLAAENRSRSLIDASTLLPRSRLPSRPGHLRQACFRSFRPSFAILLF